ncbi:hypothetical protein CH276_14155 [Rhodococcus sp. 06-470-2]|uniref:hypothetical protein n=1 Tax=unclassified Rhodococcus (in: high G+C Gram-positive bacteria) TaxID=192944 RepID=UPI000B9A88EB|nr:MULTISPECIES: hypothetical protein [unclassified Rhodococcus (in: high G+C Gram-positive bacteria)]OZC62759.1 hypothetical protein CH276_14155 [Rhodococcus sp. 06-470-2]OZE71736.1 hypothetical protein CH265_01635 [Rhodococcus sp. 05-2221-1B]
MSEVVQVIVPGPPMVDGERKPFSVAEHIENVITAFDVARDRVCDRILAEAEDRLTERRDALEGKPEINEHDERVSALKEKR